jgi:hypothetical protein
MNRRQRWSLLLCLLAGCSTAPLANTLDFFCPGKMYPNTVTPYGGVAIPQGPILAPAPGLTIGVPLPPGPGPVPAAVPIPGNVPPGNIQLQPPLPPPPPQPFGR